MHLERNYSLLDKICLAFDRSIRTLSNHSDHTGRTYPPLILKTSSLSNDATESHLSPEEQKKAASLMRVNHAGEIAAQALYHSQSLASRENTTRAYMHKAALEEGDHLAWCSMRLKELNSHPSYLTPVWYIGSFGIGFIAGLAGDKWSLGFIAETEDQVVKHLEKHRQLLPLRDIRSQCILKQMEEDESKHKEEAFLKGANPLPSVIRLGMAYTSKVMTTLAYWI